MQQIRIMPYSPNLYEGLLQRVSGIPKQRAMPMLLNREVVNYYYAHSEYCRLNLAVDESGTIQGTQGIEFMPFSLDGKNYIFGGGSNWYSFQPGVGAYLFSEWISSCDVGLTMAGTEDALRIVRRLKWHEIQGIKTYFLNRVFRPTISDGIAKLIVKKLVKKTPIQRPLSRLSERLPDSARRIVVYEEESFHNDWLQFRSPYRFRFAPDLAYLSWRYGPNFPVLRYRRFRISDDGRPAGYVVLLDQRDQILVAQADGADSNSLAAGIIRSISMIAKGLRDAREVIATSSDPAMQQVFKLVGFQTSEKLTQPMMLGRPKGECPIDVIGSAWLVNAGWVDCGLVPPTSFDNQSSVIVPHLTACRT